MNTLTQSSLTRHERNHRETAKIVARIERNLIFRRLATHPTPTAAKALGDSVIRNLSNYHKDVLTKPIHSRIIHTIPETE